MGNLPAGISTSFIPRELATSLARGVGGERDVSGGLPVGSVVFADRSPEPRGQNTTRSTTASSARLPAPAAGSSQRRDGRAAGGGGAATGRAAGAGGGAAVTEEVGPF